MTWSPPPARNLHRSAIDPTQDLALIIYTGGTTGKPKGAALTHANFTYDLKAIEEWGRLIHEPNGKPEKLRKGGFHTYLGVLPWYHSFGMTCCMLTAAASGSKMVCVPDPRAGKPPFTEVLRAVQQYKTTIMPAVPTIFVAFTNHPLIDQFDLTSLMGCFSGGAPLPPEVCKQFEAKTGAVIFEGYGLSETAPVATSNPTNRESAQDRFHRISHSRHRYQNRGSGNRDHGTACGGRRRNRHLRPPGHAGILE